MKLKILIFFLLITLPAFHALAQTDTTIYRMVLKQEQVNKAGKDVLGMTINGQIPGPALYFTEGDYAVIYVKNEMDVETSVHWHGILLPNFYDGVPYLTTPPILPGETQKYEFKLKQAGTYWYHSHTMLQEQSGVYGAIVIEPRQKILDYDKELVLVLSDWTNEKPMNVLRNLKRGTEWYTIKKGTATPLNQVIASGALGAQLNFWKHRMEGTDIADIYYEAFLINGELSQEYPNFEPGEKVRLRIVNAAASTAFWLSIGGGNPMLVAADGLNVEPYKTDKLFIAVAETYDFLVTIPQKNRIEFRASGQDGSGKTSAFIGRGETIQAMDIPKPDKIAMMQQMAEMEMRMGAPAIKFRPHIDDPEKLKKNWGMLMQEMDGMEKAKSNVTGHEMHNMDMHAMNDMPKTAKDTMDDMQQMDADGRKMDMDMGGEGMYSEYHYNFLKSTEKTNFPKDAPVNEILLNLTGNMQRYIWSMNGIPLSETDKIKIKKGEVTRITFNNLTMMHHPMHLHGHFFRVVNENGDYAPLKHTVNVAPMQQVTVEFYGEEYGDWFFHCHILYHMMGGMARVFSYDTPRDPRMKGFPVSNLVHETNKWYSWGLADVASHLTELNLTTSNLRNQFNLSGEYGWNKNTEAEFTYERYLYDYFTVFAGVNMENEQEDNLDEIVANAVAGFRWFTPYMFKLDVRIDNELRPRFAIRRELMLFPRLFVFGYYEYQMDFGWVNNLGANTNFAHETVWNAGAEYMLSKNFSLMASYDNRFGAGGGLSVRF
jgi:hypothetical protein